MKIEIKEKNVLIKSASSVAELARKIILAESEIDRDKEHFWVIGLKTNHGIKYVELVALGILDGALVHPREVFRMAILEGVSKIIAVHNHPSGSNEPSFDDRRVTHQLKDAGNIIGINLLDSIIVTADSHYSFLENGEL